jgi:hypothetical protein
MGIINWIIDTPFAIAGVGYALVVILCIFEASNTPVTPDEYNKMVKRKKD